MLYRFKIHIPLIDLSVSLYTISPNISMWPKIIPNFILMPCMSKYQILWFSNCVRFSFAMHFYGFFVSRLSWTYNLKIVRLIFFLFFYYNIYYQCHHFILIITHKVARALISVAVTHSTWKFEVVRSKPDNAIIFFSLRYHPLGVDLVSILCHASGVCYASIV